MDTRVDAGTMGAFTTVPIEHDDHILRARRTAASTRMAMGVAGAGVLLTQRHMQAHWTLVLAGFAVIMCTSLAQLSAHGARWLVVEESLSALAGVLIVGLGAEAVSALDVLWLVAVASGVLARGGRAHWVGRNVVLLALALPVLRHQSLSWEYAAFCVATVSLLLTAGRLTRELNHLLAMARLQADSAETLLLAGDIAARMADREQPGAPGGHATAGAAEAGDSAGEGQNGLPVGSGLSAAEQASAREALERLIAGEGLSMVVQPIVDVASGTAHAYEALARFAAPGQSTSPLHWFSLAGALGERPALERACVRAGLELLGERPSGTSLSLNVSAPVLVQEQTMELFEAAATGLPDRLAGLIVEITEETLVHGDTQLDGAIEWLRARGARLAVDDMGAGYSGLRQITSVRPSYLKLDRSLVSGIDGDEERAALISALVGYCRQVGSALVAEGVETEAELRTIARLEVPLVQGFYYARPGTPWPLLAGVADTDRAVVVTASPGSS
ncbi:MAG TPA: EAL domain-containing protein, partial [Solirubrobacteraceae bacterium]|nr:EAL domain-containing protein [Solirubrobacteraceae bacterium]